MSIKLRAFVLGESTSVCRLRSRLSLVKMWKSRKQIVPLTAAGTRVNDKKGNESRLVKTLQFYPQTVHTIWTRHNGSSTSCERAARHSRISVYTLCHGLQSTRSDLELGVIWVWTGWSRSWWQLPAGHLVSDSSSFSLFQVGWSRRHIISIQNDEFEFDSVSECVHNVGVLVHVCTDTTLSLSVRCDLEGQ